MGLVRTAAPDQEPLSLDEAKGHLKVEVDDDDDLIVALIAAARQSIEDHTLRALVTQTWQLKLDRDWPYVEERDWCGNRIVLPRPPLASVSSIAYVDLAGTTQTLAADQYVTSKFDTGEWVIEPAYDVIWPSVREQLAAITVTFVAGVAAADVPEPIKSAMKLQIGNLYQNREAVNVGNIVTVLPLAAEYLLAPYCVHAYR